ncbi:MAG TPA: hypothetical protein VF132_05190 [Rudaea sp.]
MDNTQALLRPLARAADSLSSIAKGMRNLSRKTDDDVREQFADTSKQLMDSAQSIARAVRREAIPYAEQAAEQAKGLGTLAQQRLHQMQEAMDAGARDLAQRWQRGRRDNLVLRHPVVATAVIASVAMIAIGAWRRRSAVAKSAEGSRSSASRAGRSSSTRSAARTTANGATANGATRPSRPARRTTTSTSS